MVERSGIRLITAQLRSYAARSTAEPGAGVMACAGHRALAREVAARAMVLLKNEPVAGAPVLPADPRTVQRIAVIGRLATAGNMGDFGSSRVYPPSHATPLDGIRAAFPGSEICLAEQDDPARAAEVAGRADVAIAIAGYDERDEGENISAEAMSRPELLARFPPLPPGTALPTSGTGETGIAAAGGYGGTPGTWTDRAGPGRGARLPANPANPANPAQRRPATGRRQRHPPLPSRD